MYDLVFIQPLKKLYMHGPYVTQYGFWAGKEHSDICSILTTMPATFWDHQDPSKCFEVIHRHFITFRTSIEIIIYFICLYQLVFCIGPLFLKNVGLTMTRYCYRSRGRGVTMASTVDDTDTEDSPLKVIPVHPHPHPHRRRHYKKHKYLRIQLPISPSSSSSSFSQDEDLNESYDDRCADHLDADDDCDD
jgi:hypothetical protein